MFKISPSGERRIGEDASKQVEAQTRVMTGPVADWVERVGQRLVAKRPIKNFNIRSASSTARKSTLSPCLLATFTCSAA